MNRILVAHTPLGQALWAVALTGEEAMSRVYQLNVKFKSERPDLDCQAMIGERCVIELEADRRIVRHIAGQMINFSATGRDGRHWCYEATLAPRLWHASRRSDFRIWQERTVQDIVTEMLDANAVRHEWRTKGHYKQWRYLVQYGETDLDFINRLLETEGCYYWFEHGEQGETLILGDHTSVHVAYGGYEEVPYHDPGEARAQQDHFDGARLVRQVEAGRYSQRDFDFEHPSRDLTTEHAQPCGHLYDQYELYAYPGNYVEPPDGQNYAANALELHQQGQAQIALSGRVRGAAPGHRFTLSGHPREELNRELVIVSATYDIADNAYEGRSEGEASRYHVDVQALPAERSFRPERITPKPRTRGPDTAIVVGPSGSEIHTDEYGRVKVHFHWDRHGKLDGNDSCWIRVAHPWAGAGFGAIHIPRVGQEVIVDFEHGDPDRPIITGRVYNAEQMPPWALPGNKTQSGILTRSSQGGGADNANALRFEDAAGAEELWLHAERNQRIEVEVDESHWVGNDRTKTIDRDETTHVKRHRTETVDGDETITIHQNRTETVDLDESITIHGNRSEEVDLDETIKIHKHRKERVDLTENIDIGLTRTMRVGTSEKLTVGASKTDRITRNWSLKTGKMKTETVGLVSTDSTGLFRMTNVGALYSINVAGAMNTAVLGLSNETVGMSKQIEVGRELKINAGESIQLTCGKSMISLGADGTIKIVGALVHIEGQDIVHAEGAVATPPPTPPAPGAGASLLSGMGSGSLGAALASAGQLLGTVQQVASVGQALSSGDPVAALGGAAGLMGMGSKALSGPQARNLMIDTGCYGGARS